MIEKKKESSIHYENYTSIQLDSLSIRVKLVSTVKDNTMANESILPPKATIETSNELNLKVY
ncbi:hypothetical protein DOY81_001201 [Sarcophaga bullata]|nr:hypothetical protein DOY81_001201 [Sarcophaga bullata]